METKEMTKEEVFAYLKERKIICYGIEEAHWVQEKLFELGCKNLSDNSTNIRDAYLFYINEDLQIVVGYDFSTWVENRCKAIEVSEVMSIELKEEKPKFDPKTLEDFQKVLYRSSSVDWWRLGFFEYYNEKLENKFWIIGQDVQPYEQCVPYNEDTKYLVGTTEDAPEFYRI